MRRPPLTLGGLQVGEVGATDALREEQRHDKSFTSYWKAADTFSFHLSLYAAYATYRDGRARGESPAWDDAWKPWTATELVVSPLQWRSLDHPLVLGSLGAETAALGTLTAIYFRPTSGLGPTARDVGLSVLTSFDAGVTEEALFRGFFYEELKLTVPRFWAHAVDMTAFALAHVPGEVGTHTGGLTVLEDLGEHELIALLLELAYDEGGLPESVALHALWDVVAETTSVLRGSSTFDASMRLPWTGKAAGGAAMTVPLFGGTF